MDRVTPGPAARNGPASGHGTSAASGGGGKPTPGMEQLIPVINKLQDVFNAVGVDSFDLPQIVVVGSQSSGKSSVLENLVGRDFLPRGSGIVTRRPLVLQLINLPWDAAAGAHPQGGGGGSASSVSSAAMEEQSFSEWGEFLHKPNEVFYEFSQIRDEIVRETDRVTGKNKGISNVAIHLKIYSPHVLNLTLVDLPGVTKVPVGDQPADIEQQIRRMVISYIEKPNAVILAVTPANSDLANSDALQLAREVDPEGLRTVGVLTKLDIMDKGTDAMDVLMGKLYPLKLGYMPVINRSQQDIISDKPIRSALRHEAEFFGTHPIYRTIASRCGTAFLARTLNRVLMNHIRDCLPDLRARINKLLLDAQMELATYGDPMYETRGSQGALLLQILTRFSGEYRDAIDGKLTEGPSGQLNELYGGARINYIFNEIFCKCLNQLNPNDGLTLNDIRTAIRNATGPRSALFVPEVAFELLVKRQIGRLEEPSLQCVELVYDELQRIIAQLETKELMRFATLRERVIDVTHGLLNRVRKPSRKMITRLMQLELAYINTSHPDFLAGGQLGQIFERISQKGPGATNPDGSPVAGGLLPGWGPGAAQQQQQAHHQQLLANNQPLPAQHLSASPPAPAAPLASQQAGASSSTRSNGAGPASASSGVQQPAGGAMPKDSFFTAFFGKDPNAVRAASGGPGAAGAAAAAGSGPQLSGAPSSAKSPASASSASSAASGSGRSAGSSSGKALSPSGAVAASQRDLQYHHQQQQMTQAQAQAQAQAGLRVDRLDQVPGSIRALSTPSDKERFETELIQSLLVAYFDIVRKNFKDMVPKSIMCMMVNASKESIQNELVTNLYKEELIPSLLEESPAIASRRNACKGMLEVLRKAHDILTEVRDFNLGGA